MNQLPEQLELSGVPAHVQSWSMAKVSDFVQAVLSRWLRTHGTVPHRFFVIMCPQVEINERGGLPARVIELTDPRLTYRHFTGCNKPYFVVIFTGEDAYRRQQDVQALLAWSQPYEAEIMPTAVRLTFTGANEDLEEEGGKRRSRRMLRDLLQQGELPSTFV